MSETRILLFLGMFLPVFFTFGFLLVVPFGIAFEFGGILLGLLAFAVSIPVWFAIFFIVNALFRIPFRLVGLDIFPLKQIYRWSIAITDGEDSNGET